MRLDLLRTFERRKDIPRVTSRFAPKKISVKNLKLITCIFSKHKLEQKKLKCNFKAAYESYGHQETIYISSRKLPNYFTTSIVNCTISIYLSAGYVECRYMAETFYGNTGDNTSCEQKYFSILLKRYDNYFLQ